jgi:hypothetical protein
MKAGRIRNTTGVLAKIGKIEKEVSDLKFIVLSKLAPTGKKNISLKGILKGVNITDADVALAKRSLHRKLGAWPTR